MSISIIFPFLEVKPNQPAVVNIKGQSNNSIVLRNVSVDISYVTFQVHSQTKNITLSSTPKPVVGKSVTGVDVGIVTILETNQTEVTCYILSNYSEDVQIHLAIYLMSGNSKLMYDIIINEYIVTFHFI